MKFSVNNSCPCGSGKKYKKCCRIYHKGAYAKDALTLMKSRYSAFAVGEIDYILKTAVKQDSKDELIAFSRGCDFHKLEILDYGETFVTFRATIFCGEENHTFIERSKFKKVDGRWLYESGEFI